MGEVQALSHGDSKLMYFWVKPEIIKKMNLLSKYSKVTNDQLIEEMIEDVYLLMKEDLFWCLK